MSLRPSCLMLIAPLLVLCACNGGDTGVGGVSHAEAQALNEAAESLDAQDANASKGVAPGSQ
jgi:hypothetical protein